MDNPQYIKEDDNKPNGRLSFKPYYKWITLNTFISF